MATTLKGLNPTELADIMRRSIIEQRNRLIAEGWPPEKADKIIANAFNALSWGMGVGPSPLGD